MTTLVLLGIPVAGLGLVLLLGFVGCGLQTSGLPEPTFDDVVSAVPSLVSWWHLDESSGPIAKDSTDGHDGTYVSAPVDAGTQSAAAPGTLDFGQSSLIPSDSAKTSINVNGGGVQVPFASDLNKPQFTIQAFVRTNWSETDDPAYRCVIFAEDSAVTGERRGFSLYANPNNTWEVFVGDGKTFNSVAADTPIDLGSIEYLAATYDGTTLTLYIHGEAHGSAALAFEPNTSHPLSIGQGIAGPFNPGFPFNGQLAEVAYYNAALDAETIMNIRFAAFPG
jgi:hypothetical protein